MENVAKGVKLSEIAKFKKIFLKNLADFKSSDSNLDKLGAKLHQYKLGPVVSRNDIYDFEKRQGIKLPYELVLYLVEVGNGCVLKTDNNSCHEVGPGPGTGLYSLANFQTNSYSKYEFPFCKSQSPIASETVEEIIQGDYWSDIPGTMIIGSEGGAHRYLLVLNGTSEGSVWEHHDEYPLIFLQDSFLQWMLLWNPK